MKDLRFRVWNAFEGQMWNWDAVNELHTNGSYCFLDMIKDGLNIMQYTGLKDGASIEIYEGDICKFYSAEQGNKHRQVLSVGVVTSTHGGWYFTGTNCWTYSPILNWSCDEKGNAQERVYTEWREHSSGYLAMVDFNLKVIGNIYEYPELI